MNGEEFGRVMAQRFGTSRSPKGIQGFAARLADLGHTSQHVPRSISRWLRAGPPGEIVVILRLLEEVKDLQVSVIAFGSCHAVNWAKGYGLPDGHLMAGHYDILERAGASMDYFTRSEVMVGAPPPGCRAGGV